MKPLIPLALLATLSIAPGQVLHPDARSRVTNPPANDSGGGGDTVIQRQPENKPAASPMGNELPFMDPSAETVSWNGHTWAATDNRLLAARFERYLNEPEDNSEDALDYRATIDSILELVSLITRAVPTFLPPSSCCPVRLRTPATPSSATP
jgi:hypothetical protein